jgi:hypothetical protein
MADSLMCSRSARERLFGIRHRRARIELSDPAAALGVEPLGHRARSRGALMTARTLPRRDLPPSGTPRATEKSTPSCRNRACAEALADLLLWYARCPRPSNETEPQE